MLSGMKQDGRKLAHNTLENIRRMAVKRVQEGEPASVVIRSYGFGRTVIYKWLALASKPGGARNLTARKATGRPRRLSLKQETQVRRFICGKDPRQYGFDFGLWTRKIIAALVEERFHVALSVNAIGRLLARLGITPQKPLRRAYERDPEAVAKWERQDYPALRAKAKRRGAEIFFLDEAGFRSDDQLGRTYGAKGKTPIVKTTGQRQSCNAISAISPRGAFWFNLYTGRLNKETFIGFLKDFRRGRRRPVYIVLDRHPAHVAKLAAAHVQSLRGALELHFLPGYAPDLNPDEFVWAEIKTNGMSKRPLRKNESLKTRLYDDLAALSKRRSRLRSVFHAPSVSYIMD
jgi:transposase